MWNKLVCFLFGHEFSEKSEYYGKLDNGLAAYKLIIGNCKCCGKEPEGKSKRNG